MQQAIRVSGSFGLAGIPTPGSVRMWLQFDEEPPIEVRSWMIFDAQTLTIFSVEQGLEMAATMGRHFTCTFSPVGGVETVQHGISTLKVLSDPTAEKRQP